MLIFLLGNYKGAPQGSILHELNQDSYPTQGPQSVKLERNQKKQMDKLNYINAWNQVE